MEAEKGKEDISYTKRKCRIKITWMIGIKKIYQKMKQIDR